MNQGSYSQEEESQSAPQEQECFQNRKYCSMGREFLYGGLQEEPSSHPRSGEGESKGWGMEGGGGSGPQKGQRGLKPLEWTMLTPPFNL